MLTKKEKVMMLSRECYMLRVVCVALILFGCSLHAEAAIWEGLFSRDVPMYPALRKIKEQAMTVDDMNMKIILFEGEDISIPHAIDYYKKILGQKGWQTANERAVGTDSMMVQFSHEDGRVISLHFVPGSNFDRPANSVIVQAVYIPQTVSSVDLDEVILNGDDVPGNDIPGLARYPGSIRLRSMTTDAGFQSASYNIPNSSCIECVADFYNQDMAQNGWTLLNSRSSDRDEVMRLAHPTNTISPKEKQTREMLFERIGVDTSALSQEEIQEKLKASLPNSMTMLLYEKGNIICKFSIVYIEPREDEIDEDPLLDALLNNMDQFAPEDEEGREVFEEQRRAMKESPEFQELMEKHKERMRVLTQAQNALNTGLICMVTYMPKQGKR